MKLNYNDWFDKYKPIMNHIDHNSCFGGYAFETYGEECDFVCCHNDEFIWTYFNTDNEEWISSGYHWVNRLLYFVSKVPCEDYSISIDLLDDEDRIQIFMNNIEYDDYEDLPSGGIMDRFLHKLYEDGDRDVILGIRKMFLYDGVDIEKEMINIFEKDKYEGLKRFVRLYDDR